MDLNFSEVEKKITRFIREYVEKAGAEGIVLGLSGGIDSGTVAALSSLAIGGKRVTGLILPEKETFSSRDIDDAKLVAEKFGLETHNCDITPILEKFYKEIPIFDRADKICKGNIKARTRMVYLYYYANKLNKIVVGSSDKSETLMGYFTKWGDAAADISPLMDLYKTQVRRLAVYLGLPTNLIAKPSTPALWPGQLAEAELGINFDVLDLILYGLERFMPIKEIAKQLSVKKTLVDKVKKRWLSTEHKRRMPLTLKIGYRTAGADFRLPRST